MKCTKYGPEDGDNLAVILGWGNRAAHEPVEWLLENFADEGYSHELFSSKSREEHLDTLLAVIDAGAAGLDR